MRNQVVNTAPRTIVVGQYLTAKGVRLKKEGATKEELAKYTKNRRQPNPESKPFTTPRIDANGRLKNKQRHIKHLV